MNQGTYIFTQVIEYLPRSPFEICVKKYHGESYTKSLSCRDQLLALMFGQSHRTRAEALPHGVSYTSETTHTCESK
jgi:hypothetical protein